uniref:Uncharacterized protein n=1 Tax=Paramormyrops kingsleyae TaxID=1676925 RepID=A0A3B3QPH9_9TELE
MHDINIKRTVVLRALAVYLREDDPQTTVVVEDEFVLSNIPTFPEAFVLLFGLMYALHLDYPRKLIHTFTFIQKILMGLDDGKPLKPCLLNLKNELLRTL